jgi:hypothetical protein
MGLHLAPNDFTDTHSDINFSLGMKALTFINTHTHIYIYIYTVACSSIVVGALCYKQEE